MPADQRPLALALMGPTASGKTALALALAQRWGAEIVSVDSALVYRGLDIGTAKPDAAMRAQVPHHMLDLREPWQPYSAAEFACQAHAAINAILARGRLPILVGGTGLYFRGLLNGLAPLPEADPQVRAALAAEATRDGWARLHARLAQVDPIAAARIHPTDPQRIQRALEVYRVSGQPISHWQSLPSASRLPVRVLKLVLAPRDRSQLHARIERRLEAMLAQGLLEEVRALRALPQLQTAVRPLDLPALRSVGYRQAWEYLDGQGGAQTLRERVMQATRQLAKRQLTWLRGEFDARWFDSEQDADELHKAIAAFLGAPGPLRRPVAV